MIMACTLKCLGCLSLTWHCRSWVCIFGLHFLSNLWPVASFYPACPLTSYSGRLGQIEVYTRLHSWHCILLTASSAADRCPLSLFLYLLPSLSTLCICFSTGPSAVYHCCPLPLLSGSASCWRLMHPMPFSFQWHLWW